MINKHEIVQINGGMDLEALVCGCGRSGTNYLSALLNRDSKICGHEEVFSLYRRRNQVNYRYESSWYAAPLIPELLQQTRILHIVREPSAVIGSLHRIGMLAPNPVHYMFGSVGNAMLTIARSPVKAVHRVRFAQRHRRLVAVHTSCFNHASEFKRLECYWRSWNQLVEESAMSGGKPYLRVQLETLDDRLEEVSEFLGLGWTLSPMPATNKKPDYKRDGLVHERLDHDTITLACRYGYDL
jgi:hypothetical protein